MEPIYLTALAENAGHITEHLLPLQGEGSRCSIRLRNLPGASAIHLLLSCGEAVKLRAEVPADGNESIWVQVAVDAAGNLQVHSPDRNLITLPANALVQPAPPIRLNSPLESLDLAIVIDGTTRFFARDQEQRVVSSPLLEDKERWASQVEALYDFIETIAGDCKDWRSAVLAFGDHQPLNATASDLRPRYHLYPIQQNSRALQSLSPQQIREQLLAIPATSGGDFVDALADALACCCELRWRAEARKLVMVSGDSPGHSIIYPVPKGGDTGIRENDVDTQAMRLHRLGVELLTVYHAPMPDIFAELLEFKRHFLDYARAQYHRLATLPELAFSASGFAGAAAAQVVCSQTGFIGRGGTFGELLEIQAGPEAGAAFETSQ